jgi:phosphoribosylanthranilate isomerase
MSTEVKICGLSTAETVSGAIEAGADYIGLVFYPPSPRHVDIATAARLAETARGRARIVALIVDAPDALVGEIARTVRPDFFQAHGGESSERIKAIRTQTRIPVIKAVKVREESDLALAQVFDGIAEMILFDAKTPEALLNALPGGNGVSFDWRILHDGGFAKRFMLSGGLNPGNVAEAIAITGAPIVDVSSGVETAPGRKDLGLIRAFLKAARKGEAGLP